MTQGFFRGFVPPPRVEEVGEGAFAYVHPDGSWGLSNSGFITNSGDVSVIDSLLTEDRTRYLREAVEATTGHPARTLLNTHWHGDHTFGNFLFPDAVIVAHRRCRENMLSHRRGLMERDPAVPWGDIEIRPPQVVFDETLDIYVGDTLAQLLHVGPAHTADDVIVWLPEQRVLYAGDVLLNHAAPIIVDGSLSGSIAALDYMLALDPAAIVPGHGDVCGPEVIKDWLRYFAFLLQTAEQATAAGVSPLEAARSTELGEFGEWQHPERIVMNLHRAMAELRGATPGEEFAGNTAFTDMLSLNPASYGHRLVEGREEYVC